MAVVRPHLKRWTGVSVGWVLSFETGVSGSRWSRAPRRQQRCCAINASAERSCGVGDPKHAEKLHAREPRDLVAAHEQAVGRREKAMSDKTLMNGSERWYCGVVPTKQPNKSERSPAEV